MRWVLRGRSVLWARSLRVGREVMLGGEELIMEDLILTFTSAGSELLGII